MNGVIDYTAYRLTADSNLVAKPLPSGRGLSITGCFLRSNTACTCASQCVAWRPQQLGGP